MPITRIRTVTVAQSERQSRVRSRCASCAMMNWSDEMQQVQIQLFWNSGQGAQEWICKDCIRHYNKCEECNSYWRNIYGGSQSFCGHCSTTDLIRNHTYRVQRSIPYFYGDDGPEPPAAETPYFGVELEVSMTGKKPLRRVTRDVAEALQNIAILKHDGSVRDGFEIASAPGTRRFHQKAWKQFFDVAIKNELLQKMHQSCGMHIHLSKSALGRTQITNMAKFVYLPENRSFMEAVGERRGNHYCNYEAHSRRSRYTAFNRRPTGTVEFRLFQGVVDEKSFMKNLEFVDALREYMGRRCTKPVAYFGYESFCVFVNTNRENFPYLYEFLRAKRYITNQTPKVEAPAKRKRRTKAEVEAARAAALEASNQKWHRFIDQVVAYGRE